LGTILGIAIVIAFIFAAIDGATKPRRRRRRRSRRNNDNNGCIGCLTVIAILICLWFGSIAVNFIKAHSTAFIVGGIVLVLIIVVAAIVFNATQTEEFPEDVEPTYPKISDTRKTQSKQQVKLRLENKMQLAHYLRLYQPFRTKYLQKGLQTFSQLSLK
jgi:amino acid transporter